MSAAKPFFGASATSGATAARPGTAPNLGPLRPVRPPTAKTSAARSAVGIDNPKSRPETTAAAEWRRVLSERSTSPALFMHVSHEIVIAFRVHAPSAKPQVVRRQTGFA